VDESWKHHGEEVVHKLSNNLTALDLSFSTHPLFNLSYCRKIFLRKTWDSINTKFSVSQRCYDIDLSILLITSRYHSLDFADCQFGRSEQKPTHIWTNDDKLGRILEVIGGTCNCPRPHEDGVRGAGNTNFAALPMKLCEVISEYVTSKHSQLRFDDLLLQSDRYAESALNESKQ